MQTVCDPVEVCKRITDLDDTYTIVNLNSHATKSESGPPGPAEPETTIKIANAIKQAGADCKVEELHLAGSMAKDDGAQAIAEALEVNQSIKKLTLETNHIGGDGITAILTALQKNSTLAELKLTNQSKPIPNSVEREVANLIDSNTTLQKLSLSMREQSSRNSVDRVIFRNKDLARKKRVEAKHAQERAEREAAKAAK